MGVLHKAFFIAAAAPVLGFALGTVAVQADDFYKDRDMRMIISSAPGGQYDIYARMMGKHIVRFLPGGTAKVLPVNMPGGAGIRAINYVHDIAPKDGSVMVIPRRGLPLYQAMGGKAAVPELAKMNWLCDMSDSPPVLTLWHLSPTKTLEDAKKRETIIGGSGGDSVTSQVSEAYNHLLGTKLKVISGYKGGPDINLAMERGEVDGRATNNMAAWKALSSNWAREGKLNFLIILGLQRDSDFPDVPLLTDLVTGDPEKVMMARFLTVANTVGRPIVVHSQVPPERVALLRAGCAQVLKDPEFLAEGDKIKAEFSFRSGEDVQSLIAELMATPQPLIEQVKKYTNYKEETGD